mgnify:CR=1 FL=1
MKKLTALLLALVMALSLTACSFVMLPEEQDPPADPKQEQQLAREGTYTTKEDVALYIHLYGRLPDNFITKKEVASSWAGPEAPWSLMPRAAASAAAGSATMRACCRRPTAAPGPSATSTPWAPSPGDRSGSSFPTMG